MSMKRGIINMLMALAASAAMTFVGCNEVPEEVTPIFPEKITASVEAGEEYEFSFTANMSWKLQIRSIEPRKLPFRVFHVKHSSRYFHRKEPHHQHVACYIRLRNA